MAKRQILAGRKSVYYLGLGVGSLGFVAFATVLASLTLDLALNTSRWGSLRDPDIGWGVFLTAVVGGTAMMIGGGLLMCLGRLGSLTALRSHPLSTWLSALEPWTDLKVGTGADTVDLGGIGSSPAAGTSSSTLGLVSEGPAAKRGAGSARPALPAAVGKSTPK